MDEDAAKRKALNAAWNGAGAYDIEPAPWQVFAGREKPVAGVPLEVTHLELPPRPDAAAADKALLYHNTASGLMWKWFDGPGIVQFADRWAEDFRASRLDELCWLAFAEASYRRERLERPALEELHAAFLLCLPQAGRDAITRLGTLDGTQERIQESVLGLARELYQFDGRVVQTPDAALHLGVSLLGLSMRADLDQPGSERLHIRSNPGAVQVREGGRLRLALSHFLAERAERKAQANRAYVERCFGPLACPPAELEALERATCIDVHAGCRLWIADGFRAPGDLAGREFRAMQASADEQLARNRAFYNERRRAFEAAIEKLALILDDRLHSTIRYAEPGHRFGALDPGKAWRTRTLDDNAVFRKRIPVDAPDLRIDLLLDASGSRSEQQEAIAAQAYVLARALARCRIPIRICAFSSLRDHTVLRLFCTYGQTDGIGNVMRYFAAGMNRDGLALRAMGRLMEGGAATRGERLLLVLTDGSPMDDHAMPDAANPTSNREYLGKPAVKDTAAQVRALRRQGIQVAALYQGPDDYLGNARKIYGAQMVRIQQIERMASAAAQLVASALQ